MTYNFKLGKSPEGEEIFLGIQLDPREGYKRISDEIDLRLRIRELFDGLNSPKVSSGIKVGLQDEYNDLIQEARSRGMVLPHFDRSSMNNRLTFL